MFHSTRICPHSRNLDEISNQWLNFIHNKEVDHSILSPGILASWKRSKAYGVTPYGKLDSPPKNLDSRLNLSKELIDASWSYIELIGNIVEDSQLRFDLFDREGYSLKILGDQRIIEQSMDSGFCVGCNRNEKTAGTNAVALALIHHEPIQVLGPEHYNHLHHNMDCSAAPIHDIHGNIIGIINISSYVTNQNSQTLGLVTSIAKVIENRLALNKTIGDLTTYNDTMNKIMEYLPKGLAYVDKLGQLTSYNSTLLGLFEISSSGKDGDSRLALSNYLDSIPCWQQENEIINKEILLKIHHKTKSFILSTRKINNQGGTLIIIEDTDSILKLNTHLRGNKTIYTFDDIIGEDPKILEAKSLSKKISASSASVLIHGESGTGKELFAQSIHNASLRRGMPFVAINCGAIPSELIESELFGYEAGAFTGALKGGKPGKFEIASNGTLFLDEIESMPLNVQIKLLRALSTHKIVRIGGLEDIPINLRIISATKKDLLQEVDQGNFREDLYYRINIVNIKLPPLRERPEDISLIAKYYMDSLSKQFCLKEITVTDEFYDALTYYYWRGNIRELKNVIERTLLLINDDEQITLHHLPKKIISAYHFKQLKNTVLTDLMEKSHKENNLLQVSQEVTIHWVLKQEKYNLSQTAKKLGISRSTLYQKIKGNPRLMDVLNSNPH